MKQTKTTAGHLLSMLTILIWGATFISTKVLLRAFRPVEILAFRFLLGTLALCVVCPHRLKLADRKQEKYFIGAGFCGVTLYFLLENIALTYTPASNVGGILSVAPFFTALFAHWFPDGEKLRAPFFIGFLAAFAGICMISFNSSTVLKLNPMGDLLAVLAAVVWALYSVLTRKISQLHDPMIQTTRRIFFYGLLFMVPTPFFLDFHPAWDQRIQPIHG